VRVALLKVPGVESVDVSLERAIASIRLRAGNAVTLPQIRELVKNNGFTAKDARITVVGTLVERGGKPAIDVTGTNTVMLLAPDAKQPEPYTALQARLRDTPSTTIELTGDVETRPDQPDTMIVRRTNAIGR
jgi:copper chaperone CopZ